MKSRRLFNNILLALVFVMLFPSMVIAKKKVKTTEPQKSKYEKLISKPGTVKANGFINLYWADNKVYMEIPSTIFGRRILMGAMVDKMSNPQESAIGYCTSDPIEIKFARQDSLVRVLQVTQVPECTESAEAAQALSKSFTDKIIKQFSIMAFSPDSAAVIDVTDYVFQDDKQMNAIDPNGFNSMDGWIKRKASFKSNRSMISGITAYSDNVSVACSMSYDLSISLFGIFSVKEDVPFTAVVKRTFMLLPENSDFKMRLADARVGTLWSTRQDFNPSMQGSKQKYYVNRWNLKADKPIVFYVDTLLPDDWKRCVEQSAEIWNKSFRKIGYTQAIELRPYSCDSTFDANNMAHSCIRYVLSPAGKVSYKCWCDPQTGEILNANIYMPHNLASQIQQDAFLQVSAFEPKARSLTPDSTIVDAVLTSQLLKSFGHCLGLTDNMAGSIAYPIDSLRSESFVKQHGLSASVMDYLPMNYLHSKDTYHKIESLAQHTLGVYDEWALHYLYGSTGKASTSEELPILRSWVAERNNNPLLLYKRPQSTKAYYDPRGMKNDLGNDAVRSAAIAFKNMAEMIANANAWLDKEDLTYEERVPLYGHIINQADEYVKHVLQQVGGFYLNDTYQGDSYPTFQSVPKDVQRKSFRWMLEALQQMTWLDNTYLLNHCALTGSAADYGQKFFGNLIFVQLDAMWLSESKSADPYTQEEAVADLKDFLFKESRAGKVPADFKRFMQSRYLDALITWSDVNGNSSGASSSSSSSSSLTDYRPYKGMTAIESISYKGSPVRQAFWYSCLLDLKSEFQKAKALAPTRDLRDEYDYRLYTLRRALEK